MKIAWLTDIHLDFVDTRTLNNLSLSIEDKNVDALFITGDISTAHKLPVTLEQMFPVLTDKPIYFILGNHDYYGSSIEKTRDKVTEICNKHKQLTYLQNKNIIKLNKHTVLIGGDSWYDLGFGNYKKSPVLLNDFYQIDDFLYSKNNHETSMQNVMSHAFVEAKKIDDKLNLALQDNEVKKIYCLHHVPPYQEVQLYKGRPSDPDFLPFFGCRILGEKFDNAMKDRPDVQLVSLSGHTHCPATYQRANNILVKVGKSEYYDPQVSEIIEI